MTDGKRPLEGIRVDDLGRTLAAPLATQMLADLGAGVIEPVGNAPLPWNSVPCGRHRQGKRE